MNNKKTVCFAASSGGHYEQLIMLKPLMEKYDSFILTEKTSYKARVRGVESCYVHQVNRKEKDWLLQMVINIVLSIKIYVQKRPKVVICTGVLAVIPMCLLVKLFGGELIYIESFAKITSPTKTGKILYRIADQFYVQWDSMKEFYPNAICLGGIY